MLYVGTGARPLSSYRSITPGSSLESPASGPLAAYRAPVFSWLRQHERHSRQREYKGSNAVPISSFGRKRVSNLINRYCDQRVPPPIRAEPELRFRFEGNSVLLYERRPAWNRPGEWTESNVAKFRYFVGREEWVLYWRDRYGRWKRYDLLGASLVFEDLLSQVDEDPTGIFWG